MFFRRKKKQQQTKNTPRPQKPKRFVLYRGAGYGGESRVEKIELLFYDDGRCEGAVNIGDFTVWGGTGFSLPVPKELAEELSAERFTDFFKPEIEKYSHGHDYYFKITIPDELKEYVASNFKK